MKTYLYTNGEDAAEALASGLKLSDAATGAVRVYGNMLPCIGTYLHPQDAPEAVRNDPARYGAVLKITPREGKAFIADAARTGALYNESVIPFASYRLGMYRKPRCLLVTSVFPDALEPYDGRRDEALLYESSEQLYTDALFASADDADPGFRTAAL